MAKVIAHGTHRTTTTKGTRYVIFRFFDDGLVRARVDNEAAFSPWTTSPVKLSYIMPVNEALFNTLFKDWK